MNPIDDNEPVQIGPDPDKLFVYHRQQLSAMLDGELSPDEARFMLRRLQHDTVLASCWERWQVCGDVLRGQRNDLLPADFAQRVAQGLAGDADAALRDGPGRAATPRILRWGGGAAVAASVALLAVFATRQLPGPDELPEPAPLAAEVAAPAPVLPSLPVDSPAEDRGVGQSRAPASAVADASDPAPGAGVALAASAVALTEAPRRAAGRRAQSRTATVAVAPQPEAPARSLDPVAMPDVSGAAPAPAMAATADESAPAARAPTDPFAMPPGVGARPWPRSLLPAANGYTVAGGGLAPREPVFEPFRPSTAPALSWPTTEAVDLPAGEARQP